MNNQRALALLFTATAISGFAQGISMMAIPFYFARQQQGPTFNFLYGCATFLVIFWGLYAGTLVDRFPRKQVFLGTNLVEGLVVLGVAGYGWTNPLTLLPIGLVFLVTFFGYQVHYPTLYAFAQEITRPEDYKRVTSAIEIVGQGTSLASGGAAAVLLEGVRWSGKLPWGQDFFLSIPRWELHHIFALDGVTYVIAFALIVLIRYVPYRKIDVETGNLAKRLRSGIAYLQNHSLILLFGLLSFNLFVAALVQLQALLPMYITNHLRQGGQTFGLAELTGSIGAMSAGILTKRLFADKPIPQAIIMVMVLASLNFFMASFNHLVWVFLLFSMLNGFFNSSARILRVSYLFDSVPNELIGRVNSILGMLNVLIRLVFIFLFSQPFFGKGSNITYAYFTMGVFVMLSGIVLGMNYRRLLAG